jgi:hypothetical protein
MTEDMLEEDIAGQDRMVQPATGCGEGRLHLCVGELYGR